MNSYSLAGKFLISMPALQDGIFARSVVYLCQHDDTGAVGFVINKPVERAFTGQILKQLKLEQTDDLGSKVTLLKGGPVQLERGFVIHPANKLWRATFEPNTGVAVTTSLDILESISCGEGPNKALLVLGYAGWEAGQLENEIKANAWLTADFNHDILFNTSLDKRWKQAANVFGFDLETMVMDAGHA